MTPFYDRDELARLGLGSFGSNVMISRKTSIYNPGSLFLASHVRIDDFSIVSAAGGIEIGNYVHIGAFCALYGGSGIKMDDFSGLSPRTTLFSESDDFSGESMIHPFFPIDSKPRYRQGKIVVSRFAQTGCGTTVLPNVTIGVGSVTGAHSLVIKSLPPWGIFIGTPARLLGPRSKRVTDLAKSFLEDPQ